MILASGSALVSQDNVVGRPASLIAVGGDCLGSSGHALDLNGLCTLDVQVVDSDPNAVVALAAYNGALKLRVSYRSGSAQNVVLVDAAAGHQLAIGAASTLSVEAFYEPAGAGDAVLVPTPQRVDVAAHLRTSKSGWPAVYTSPGVAAGVFVRVPPKASRMGALALGATPLAAGSTAMFSTIPSAAGDVYTTPVSDVSDLAVPVALGARWVRLAGIVGRASPVWYLWT